MKVVKGRLDVTEEKGRVRMKWMSQVKPSCHQARVPTTVTLKASPGEKSINMNYIGVDMWIKWSIAR